MVKQVLEDMLSQSGHSVYRLVRMASQRALELSDGKPSLVKHELDAKVTSVALEEIRTGRVEIKSTNSKKN